MSEAFVTFREALEATLVIGILARYAPASQWRYLWGGIISAVAVSLLSAFLIAKLTTLHQIWEVIFSSLASILLISMVVWMRRQGGHLTHQLQKAAQTSTDWLLFGISFTTILREGLETVLFLRTLWAMQQGLSLIGGLAGLLIAIGIGILIFIYGRRIPLGRFFQVTSILLLLIAAGMAAYAVHELVELIEEHLHWEVPLAKAKAWSLFPPLEEPPPTWLEIYTFHEGKYYHPLHHKGWIGGLLHVLTGWRASMTWLEVGVWIIAFLTGFLLWRKNR